MINFLFGLFVGVVGGFIGGLFYYAKKVHKRITTSEVTRETINSLIQGEEPKGEIIINNQIEQLIKDHDGDLLLADVIEDGN